MIDVSIGLVFFLMQQLPSVPKEVKNESIVAILYVLLLFFTFAMIVLIAILVKLPPMVKSLTDSMDRRAQSNLKLAEEIAELKTQILAEVKEAKEEAAAVRTHIHDRVTPIIHAQALGLLKLTRMEKEAREIERLDDKRSKL